FEYNANLDFKHSKILDLYTSISANWIIIYFNNNNSQFYEKKLTLFIHSMNVFLFESKLV
ncbi:hypothetical protein L9F63_016987, partial [Diploptera punctata]